MKNPRWLLVGILIILTSSSLLIGAGSCSKAETAIQVEQQGNSFIWKVTSATTHVYILGSVHVASPDLYPLDTAIEDAFASADYLVVEVNTNKVSQIEQSELLVQYGTYPQGDSLKNHIPDDLYNKLKELFQKHEIDIALMNNYKPWVIYNFMSQLILDETGYKIENGIDLYFLDKAESTNKAILELESTEYQLSLLASVPDEINIQMIQYDIENEATDEYLQGLFSAWEDGDIVKMEAVAFELLVAHPEMAPYYETMYDRRNRDMAQKIKEYLAGDKTYFIVIGAGHLVGENGILNLLVNQ